MSLKGLYERVKGDRVFYQDEPYSEAIVVASPDQRVVITESEGEMKVLYYGDAQVLRETIDSLGLPDHLPNIAGEQVFYMMRYHLQDMEGQVEIEQTINPVEPQELEGIIKKLAGRLER